MNLGEPWGEVMRTEQMANKIKNQNFFQRNLFSRMFGWFLIRLVDREFECSTLEDVEGLCPVSYTHLVPIPGMTNTLFPALRPVIILSLIIINK